MRGRGVGGGNTATTVGESGGAQRVDDEAGEMMMTRSQAEFVDAAADADADADAVLVAESAHATVMRKGRKVVQLTRLGVPWEGGGWGRSGKD